ncbi:lysoplasmalogenase family protein [Aquiflexum sp.]|uniref:lysoplasmalogenase family protein n=1 Tax=Aquiflexum sp. TaxID=1872584 RepID=UPI0035947E20
MTNLKTGFYFFNLITLPILIIYLILRFKDNNHSLMPLMIVAIFFSFIGDIFMLPDIEINLFKTLGICTFIVAQTFYGLLYIKSSKLGIEGSKPKLKKLWPEFVLSAILGVYASMILSFTDDLFFPSLFYSFIGIGAFILAMNRRFFVSRKSFNIVFFGAFLFIVSASITGMDFYSKDPIRHAISILAYTMAHYLISYGILLQIQEVPEPHDLFDKSKSSISN